MRPPENADAPAGNGGVEKNKRLGGRMQQAKNTANRAPPSSIEAEQAVLGALLLKADALSRIDLVPDDFWRADHREIFSAIQAEAEAGRPFDAVTLAEKLCDHGDMLVELARTTAGPALIESYSGIVREKARQRALIEAGTSLVNASFDGQPASEVATTFSACLARITASAGPLLARVDVGDLLGAEIKPPGFVLEQLVPQNVVTLLTSHGGFGKSVLVLTLCAHVAAWAPWSGFDVLTGRAVYVSLEDGAELVRFRLRRIIEAYGLDADRVARNLTILDGSGRDGALAVEVAEAGVRRLLFTPLLSEVERAAQGCRLIAIDNASDAFDGNENERRQVRAFIRRLAALATTNEAGLVLLAHLDKAGARFGASGNSYSGSTAWHNSVRSRLALVEQDGQPSLVQEKLNLGRRLSKPLPLHWSDHGVLMPVSVPREGSGDGYRLDDDAAVLAALRAAAEAGVEVTGARAGTLTTWHLLSDYPELPERLRTKDGRRRFWESLARLQRYGRVRQFESKKGNRHARTCLEVVPECASLGAPVIPPIPPCATGAAPGGAPVAPVRERSTTDASDATDAAAYRAATKGE